MSIRHASWLLFVALLVTAGLQMSSQASESSAEVVAASSTVEAAEGTDLLEPQATCSAIKCPPGKICVNTLQCTPAGDCFHVGRCVAAP